MGIAGVLKLDYGQLASLVEAMLRYLLTGYEPAARALQRELLKTNRVRGTKLAHVLSSVAPTDLAAVILARYAATR